MTPRLLTQLRSLRLAQATALGWGMGFGLLGAPLLAVPCLLIAMTVVQAYPELKALR